MDLVSLQEELPIPGSTELCQAWCKGAVRVLTWFPGQSRYLCLRCPCQVGFDSPVWCSVLGRTFPCNCLLQHSSLALQCGCSGSRDGRCCACGSDPVWQLPFL